MAASSIPSIPPRPSRSQHAQTATAAAKDIPQIPPRPANRHQDRSVSPFRDNYAPSPLNENPPALSNQNGFYSSRLNPSTASLPRRPPSVTIPSIGQEGLEYANIPYEESDPDEGSTQVRNVGSDVQVHAPKASLPPSAAKGRVAGVTRMDSSQVAAAGFGTTSDHKQDHEERAATPKASMSRTGSTSSAERPDSASLMVDEHGIPQLGARVPLYPNYGDVQAPSPASFMYSSGTASAGSHRPGSHHHRTRSGRESITGTPDIYGLRHPAAPPIQDQFEKAWYQENPGALAKDGIGEWEPALPPKAEWALSSDELNRLVRESASRASTIGKEPPAVGTPDEQTGYIGAEEYALRLAGSRPQSTGSQLRTSSMDSTTHAESPLRKTSFPTDISGGASKDPELQRVRSRAIESEAGDEEVIHVDPPSRRLSRVAGAGFDGSNADGAFEDELLEDRDYSAPILAPDEVAKTPGVTFLQPAVTPPPPERRGSTPHVEGDHLRSSFISGTRPQIMQGLPKQGFYSSTEGVGTPLEDVEEYEPLFPEDEDGSKKAEKPLTVADRLKRPDLNKQRFPSRDIWEDAPDSLRLETTVSTPELPVEQEKEEVEQQSTAFETPEQEAARKHMDPDDEENRASFLPDATKRFINPHLKPHLRDEFPSRPNMQHRFPSRDIWEDTPDSLQLETTVRTPEVDEARSPPEARPTTGIMAAAQERLAKGEEVPPSEERATTGIAATLDKPSVPTRPTEAKPAAEQTSPTKQAQPSVPPRPAHRAHSPEKKAPGIPDRPKPQVPARPAKPTSKGSSEHVPLSKVSSVGSTGSAGSVERGPGDSINLPPVPKHKPTVPSRPAGSKIAALKAGFMSDLESRLQAGPQAQKTQEKPVEEKEEEKEKAVLSDARKGRARGPARRKPAASPSGAEEPTSKPVVKLEVASAWTVWQISDDGTVDVKSASLAAPHGKMEDSKASTDRTPTLGTNIQGDGVHAPDEIAPGAEKAAHPPNAAEDAIRAKQEREKLVEIAPDADKHDDTTVELEKAKEYLAPEVQAPVANESSETSKAVDLAPPPADPTTDATADGALTEETASKSDSQE